MRVLLYLYINLIASSTLLLASASGFDADVDTCSEDFTCDTMFYRLSNGVLMPKVGLGTAAMRGEETIAAVRTAVKAGIRMVDTAESREWYDQVAVGQALAVDDIDRNEVFITTKINPRNYGRTSTKVAIQNALKELQVETIDLVLLHFPECWGGIPSCEGVEVEGTWQDAWKALEEAYDAGLVRAIGLSNFAERLIKVALGMAKVRPHVVQNWMDPLHADAAVRELCKKENIVYMAYSSLGGQWRGQTNPIMESRELKRIAKKHKWSVPRTVLSWQLSLGVAVIPRSVDAEHIQENALLNEALKEGLANLGLDQSEMDRLNKLAKD